MVASGVCIIASDVVEVQFEEGFETLNRIVNDVGDTIDEKEPVNTDSPQEKGEKRIV